MSGVLDFSPEVLPMSFMAGDSFAFPITFTQDGAALGVTGAAITLTISNATTGATERSIAGTVSDGALGIGQIAVTAAESDLPPGRYNYSIKIVVNAIDRTTHAGPCTITDPSGVLCV